MIVYPNAKINLGLNVIGKRADGFHNIESVFYPIPFCDILELTESREEAPRISMTLSGLEVPGDPLSNLCVKAYENIAKDYSLPPVQVHLHKQIPVGAGLGGGSSDASFFIRALNDLCELNLSFGELHHYARQLGSDCSFFINNRPSFAQQKGDELDSISLSLKGWNLVLVNPLIHVSTAEAYAGVKPAKPAEPVNLIVESPVEEWKDRLVNDFEPSVFARYPQVHSLKEKLYELGASYASMSGSGSTVYGLFHRPVSTEGMFHGCFVWQGELA